MILRDIARFSLSESRETSKSMNHRRYAESKGNHFVVVVLRNNSERGVA